MSSRLNLLNINFNMFISVEISPLVKKRPYIVLLICGLFFTIFRINMIGLLPYAITRTAQIGVTMGLALTIFQGIDYFSVLNNFNNKVSHIIPAGTPGLLIPFMVFIEYIRMTIRVLVLAVRLIANIIAGHLLLRLRSEVLLSCPVLLSPVSIACHESLFCLELVVGAVQAYVFSVLISLYCAEGYTN